MYRIQIEPVQNGWIVTHTYPNRIALQAVFSDQKEMIKYLENILPEIHKGFNHLLKVWLKGDI